MIHIFPLSLWLILAAKNLLSQKWFNNNDKPDTYLQSYKPSYKQYLHLPLRDIEH